VQPSDDDERATPKLNHSRLIARLSVHHLLASLYASTVALARQVFDSELQLR